MRDTRLTTIVLVWTVGVFVGCRGDRPTEVIQLAPPPAAEEPGAQSPRTPKPTAAPKRATPRVAKHAWSATPPHEGIALQMDRLGPDLLRVSGEHLQFDLPVPKLGDCADSLTQIETPEMMPEAAVKDRPVWLALQGDGEAASIRLSTRGALLVVDDGCEKAADITTSLLGTPSTSRDPVFAPDPVAPEESYDADDIRMKRRSATKALILVDNQPLLDVSFFNGESTLTARALDEQRWIRLLMSREWEYASNDGAVGREHTLVWTPRPDDEPLLVFDNDYRYGMDGFAREEADVVSTRVHQHPEGLLTAGGTRHLEYVQNAGRDLCPNSEQAFTFRHYVETVDWSFTAAGERKSHVLGTAKTRATFASGCLDVAEKQLKRRRERLTKRAPDAAVRWRAGSKAGL